MGSRSSVSRSPARRTVDYTDRAYWNGLIKMSLSRFFILCVLQRRPMHGYAIARAVASTTRGCCSPTAGAIYPVLQELAQGGYLTARNEVVGGRRRRVYALTDRGRAALQVAIEAWMEVARCLQQVPPAPAGPAGAEDTGHA
ncbi:MAG: hypothetical protein KatS3mg131_3326 [Candidatus Tectimicrobiota bacterium]|nr:MAG: hypothetical protein KatS3mg131_3326 [Candidatus Tectomicrobia bacterium]